MEEDYGSDTDVPSEERTASDLPVQEARPHTAPNPFAERGEANAPLAPHQTPIVGDAIITNPLDEQQQLALQHEESAQRRRQLAATLEGRHGYLFTPLGLEERIRQRQAILWQRGPSALNHHLLMRLRVAKYFARGTWNLT